MSIAAEALQRFIGKPAKDLYGRHVGRVIGFALDTFGELNAVGVDKGKEGLVEYPRNQVFPGEDALILVPNWKLETENFRKENTLTLRKLEALEELNKSGEIPQHVYEELERTYKDSMDKLQQTYIELTNELKRRADELEHNWRQLERFLANVKVQHKTGEISDEVYKVASENLILEIDSSVKERGDVLSVLETLAIPLNPPSAGQPQASQTAAELRPMAVRITDDAP